MLSLPFQIPSLICGAFKHLNCLRFYFFHHSPYWWPTDSGFFAIVLGAKCVWSHSSCEQNISSIKSMISSLVTVLGHPEPCLLSIEPVSLSFFKRHLTGVIVPLFSWMIVPNFVSVSRPAFFFVFILNDFFFFFWKNHYFLLKIHKHLRVVLWSADKPMTVKFVI